MIEGWEKYPDLILCPPGAKEIAEAYPDTDREVLKRCLEFAAPKITRGAIYMKARMTGEAERFASAVACQRFPRGATDDTFFEGHTFLGDQMPAEQLNNYVSAAKRCGFTPPAGAKYFPNLARFSGDPEAFVTRDMGRGYIRQLIEKRGGTMDRHMNATWNEPDSDPLATENCTPIAESLIKSRARERIRKNPSLGMTPQSRRKLRAQIIEDHGAK